MTNLISAALQKLIVIESPNKSYFAQENARCLSSYAKCKGFSMYIDCVCIYISAYIVEVAMNRQQQTREE